MAVSSSLQLPSTLGISKNHENNKQFKCVMGLGKSHLLRTRLSSQTSRQDSLSIRLSDIVHRPRHFLPYRSNVFNCHSFSLPDQAFRLPCVKITSMALTRSYNALQSSPLVLKLVPAVGIIFFALWGLGPLIRQIRNLFLHKSDNNWKKSKTYYVMSSYLQPLLLWTGAILICRELDPIALPSEASQVVKQRLLNFVRSLSTVLAFAYCLSSMIQQTQKFFMETNDPKDTRNMGFQFAGKAVYSAVWVAAVSLFMELLGFSTQKWLTAGGLGTVLLTLAGREIFTNFLSSAMIHATRPFVVNEWIQTKIEGYEVSGTVEHVGWWSPTIIRGEDREAVHIPNHKFTVNVVRNLSQKTHWRIKTHLAISHLDVNKINNIVADMRKVLAKNPQVEQQRLHRRVFLDNINPENQALLILISCFVKTSHYEEYLCVKDAILLDLLRVISHHRARLATPIRTIQKVYSETDLETFVDSVFARGGVASNRPLLLTEPSHGVNGEERLKSQIRSRRTNGEQDSKSSAKPAPDTKAEVSVGATTTESKAREKPALDTKADGIREIPTSDTKEDLKTKAITSDRKLGDKVTSAKPTSKPISKTESKVAEMEKSDSKRTGSVSNNSNQEIIINKQSKIGLGTNIKIDTPSTSSSETSSGKAGGSPTISPSKQGDRLPTKQPTVSRPALEENIILGVALEGSKRTLPIEEEMANPSSTTVEGKELAACRNRNGSLNSEKDKKDQADLDRS